MGVTERKRDSETHERTGVATVGRAIQIQCCGSLVEGNTTPLKEASENFLKERTLKLRLREENSGGKGIKHAPGGMNSIGKVWKQEISKIHFMGTECSLLSKVQGMGGPR